MRARPDMVFSTFDADSFTILLPLLVHVENVAADGDKSDVDADVDKDDEHLDPLWQIPDVQLLSDNDMVSPEEELGGYSPDGEKKHLIFESCLDKLLKPCHHLLKALTLLPFTLKPLKSRAFQAEGFRSI